MNTPVLSTGTPRQQGDRPPVVLDALDRRIIRATQAGLPRDPRPFHVIARQVDADAELVMQRMQRMLDNGVIRRMGVVPNHYQLGYRANGMTVWDVNDAKVEVLGRLVGALPFVSHCYQRPRHLPDWPYNLFAMVHARTREQALELADRVAALLGEYCRAHDVLFSTRILKKTGLRLSE